MTEILSLILFIIGLYALIITLSNIGEMKRIGRAKADREPFVSVCIPARNEEHAIEACIKSFLNQSYRNFELLINDDESSDRTAEIIKKYEKIDSRVHYLKGPVLPHGWKGKVNGMRNLVSHAKGEYILFTDADTIHNPDSIKIGVNLIVGNRAHFISGYPREAYRTTAIGSCISIMIFNTMCYMPLVLHHRFQNPIFSMAIGQYMMMDKKALAECGGIEMIADEITDDVGLARLFAKNHKKQMFCDMKEALTCEMYPTFKEAVNGITRSIVGAVPLTPLIRTLLLLAVLAVILFLSCPVIAVIEAVNGSPEALRLLAGPALAYLAFLIDAKFHGYTKGVPYLSHFTFICLIFMLVKGACSKKKPLMWKGRVVT